MTSSSSSPRVDAHAHVFRATSPFVTPRRYTPGYDATLAAWIGLLDRHDIGMGLLTQPSFLGTDNTQMLEAAAASGGRVRAVVVVDDGFAAEQFDEMQASGAIGVRFNLSGVVTPDLSAGRWPQVLSLLHERDWHVEIFAPAARLGAVIRPALDAGLRVCVDHFGLPQSDAPLADPGFRGLLALGPSGRVWVKLSGAYRSGGQQKGERMAKTVTPALLDAFGPGRLLWGSDWPHTQNESIVDFDSTFAALTRWVPDPQTRERVLRDSAADLMRLDRAEH